jgi:hypothetical protein
VDEASARYGFPFIVSGQAQKELFHNEALASIDAALHPAVEGAPVGSPPSAPDIGQCWLVAPNAAGAWLGKGGMLAAWTSGGWRYISPQAGMCVWDKTAAFYRRWTGTLWTGGEVSASAVHIGGLQVVGSRQPAVLSPSGGAVTDQEARTTIASLIVALQSHGLIE